MRSLPNGTTANETLVNTRPSLALLNLSCAISTTREYFLQENRIVLNFNPNYDFVGPMNVTDMAKPFKQIIGREYKWFAVYTRLNHEKSVEKSLLDQNIEAYVPTIKTLHAWSDRKKWIETPLFKSYVFVRVSNKEYFRVLHISSVLNYICFGGQASVIPDQQIEMVKKILREEMEYEVANRFYEPRELVEITSGPLAGQQGEVVKCDGKHYMLLRIDHLSHSLMVRIKSSSFRKVSLSTQFTN